MACASLFKQAGRIILVAVCAWEQLQPGEEEQEGKGGQGKHCRGGMTPKKGSGKGWAAGPASLQTRGNVSYCHLFDPVWRLDKASSWFGNNFKPSKNLNNAATCAF